MTPLIWAMGQPGPSPVASVTICTRYLCISVAVFLLKLTQITRIMLYVAYQVIYFYYVIYYYVIYVYYIIKLTVIILTFSVTIFTCYQVKNVYSVSVNCLNVL